MSFKKLLKTASTGQTKERKKANSAKNVKSASRNAEKLSAFKLLRSEHKLLVGTNYSNKLSYDELVNAESELGRTLFGQIPAGRQREFFEYRKNIWIWHESWTDKNGKTQETTIRYEVRPDGVYKKPSGGNYEKLKGKELENFVTAAKKYFELVKEKLYS